MPEVLVDNNTQLDVLCQLVCDPLNQPHQYVGDYPQLMLDMIEAVQLYLREFGEMPE